METDSFFCQLFKQLPQTLFELLDLPAKRGKIEYRFDSVELKKSLRIDGLFIPKRRSLPLYFVEVQFQRLKTFYANLFAKVFCYLEENDPKQEWFAVAIFASRKEEQKHLGPYEDLLRSKRVKRIYLDEAVASANPPLGLSILQLLFASVGQAQELAPRLVRRAQADFADSDLETKVIELVEGLLLSRFPQFGREEMRMKFKLHDIRESKVWQEAANEGIALGKSLELRQIVNTLLATHTIEEVAKMLKRPVEEIQAATANTSGARADT